MPRTSMQIVRALLLLIVCAHSALLAAEIRWQFEAAGRIIGKPTVTEERIYIAGGKTVHALTMAGEELWRSELAGDIAASVAVDGDHLFVHSSVGLHALTDAGEEIWFFASPDLGPIVDGRSWGWGNEILPDPWAERQEYRKREETFKRALVSSQKVMEQMKENAQKSAEIIISNAEVKAEKTLNRAHNRLAQLHEDIAELKRQRIQLESQIRSILETHTKLLETQKTEMDTVDEEESRLKFIRQSK